MFAISEREAGLSNLTSKEIGYGFLIDWISKEIPKAWFAGGVAEQLSLVR